MDKRPVIFLDFDGPLTNERAWLAYDKPAGREIWETADPVAIAMLNNLCAEFGAVVVISSTWRKANPFHHETTGENVFRTLRGWGFTGEFHEVPVTPELPWSGRAGEIVRWLEIHGETVSTFCALDDIVLPKGLNGVPVHADDGISHRHYEQARNFLSGGGCSVSQAIGLNQTGETDEDPPQDQDHQPGRGE